MFSCGLATHDSALDGTHTTYSLEHIWMLSALFEGLGGIISIACAHWIKIPDKLLEKRPLQLVALAGGIGGTILIWLAWIDRVGSLWLLYLPGGALAGVAIALFTLLWSKRLQSYDEAHIEFAIPLSFTIAFALYFVLLLTKRGSVFFLIFVCAMIALSFWFATGKHNKKCGLTTKDQPIAKPNNSKEYIPLRHCKTGLGSFGVVVLVSWIQIAFFRVVATPDIMGDRLFHFLIPFSSACVLSLIMLVLCLYLSRYLNISLAYRWSLPLFMLSYLPIFIDYHSPTLRLGAYALNFLGMFGVQFGCWLGACKYVRRTKTAILPVFGTYILGEGMGIFIGCLLGLFAVRSLDMQGLILLSSLLLTVVVFSIMVAGFNPQWIFNRTNTRTTRQTEASNNTGDDVSTGKHDLGIIFEKEAYALQKAYGLTARETAVATLLLAGRNRPYIRDEFVVSINTVSSHVRSIFSKCEVHSQQELIDLARGSTKKHLAHTLEGNGCTNADKCARLQGQAHRKGHS